MIGAGQRHARHLSAQPVRHRLGYYVTRRDRPCRACRVSRRVTC